VGEPGLSFLHPLGVVSLAATMSPRTLLDWLIARYPTAKRETFRRMLRDGRLRVNGARPRTLKLGLTDADRVEVHDAQPAKSGALRFPKLPFRIFHEDADILVVDKPAGLLTSTVPGERRPTLLAAVRAYVSSRDPRARVGLIHRLDRDASGLLVFSKSDHAYHSLKTQFFHHAVERVYLAITDGVPNPRQGRIESRLEERADGTVYSTSKPDQGERAITRYDVVEVVRKRALVRVTLETGRKHQIRVHLAQRRSPIAGDRIYGKQDAPAPRLMLAAVKLGFTHPRTGERVEFEVKPPKSFALKSS
jgi:23S rRNA pseudouridine1911/1915/1917 synthase